MCFKGGHDFEREREGAGITVAAPPALHLHLEKWFHLVLLRTTLFAPHFSNLLLLFTFTRFAYSSNLNSVQVTARVNCQQILFVLTCYVSLQSHDSKMCLLERGFCTLIRNVLFPSLQLTCDPTVYNSSLPNPLFSGCFF